MMIGDRRIVGLGLALTLACTVVACKRPTPGADATDAMASADAIVADSVDAAAAAAPSAAIIEPLPPDAAANVPAAAEARKTALAALLSGAGKADELPELSADPGSTFNPSLRQRLTTTEVAVPVEQKGQGVVAIGATTATVPVPNAERVIAGVRPRMRTCYRAGLNIDPLMTGKLVVGATVTAGGEIASTNVVSNEGLSPQVAQCVTLLLKRAQFDAPGGNGSTLTIPITFTSGG
jgi:hypothetical protein